MSDKPSIWSRLRRLFMGEKSACPEASPASTPTPLAEEAGLIQTSPQPLVAPKPIPRPPPQPAAPTVVTGSPAPPSPAPRVTIVAAKGPPSIPVRYDPVAVPAVDLVLGIDLGTSCSKVVIGDPGWKNRSYAVAFRRANGDISAWLYPTRFGSEANLKMRLMNQPESEPVGNLLACYLAEIIRYSRSWFAENGPADYRRREIRWSLSLGFPDKSVKESPLAAAYREIARIAVILASASGPLSPEIARKVRNGKPSIVPFIPPQRINLYPEIAAQLAGYVNSPYHQRGNLLLIDVGAGTLDVSTIILHEDQGRDIVSFHFCEVEELGVLRLYEKRTHALENVEHGCVQYSLEHFQDGSLPIPENIHEMVRAPAAAHWKAFEAVSDDFSEQIIGVAIRCLVRFRTSQRQVHSGLNFDPWGQRLRFFLTGGGCRSAFYRGHLAGGPLEQKLAPHFTRWAPEPDRRRILHEGLHLERLPLPDNLDKYPQELHLDFDRLSVAYGLALGGGEEGNLMKITNATHHQVLDENMLTTSSLS